MRKTLVLAALLLLLPCAAAAQETPTVEVFGGASYIRANPRGGFLGSNGFGWNGSAAFNWDTHWGLKADVSGYYCCSGNGQREHNFLFGPQFNVRRERATFFAHALVGFSRGDAPAVAFSDTVLAWAGGGGVDVRWTDKISIRVAQVDYFGTRYASTMQHHFRYSGGIVFKFGRK
jgi:hypothetical protein